MELTTAEILAAAKELWKPTPHPFLPWFSDDDLLRVLAAPDGAEKVARLYQDREERIWLAGDKEPDKGEPFTYGFELEHWKDADRLLRDFEYLYVAGGNRASKSEWAAKRLVKAALTYGNSIIWCLQSTEENSRDTQQKHIWKFLPDAIKALNYRNDPKHVYKVRWSLATGFTEGLLVLPNKTQIVFKTYKQDPAEHQGIELGARRDKVVPDVPNIGAWADENMTVKWLETLKTRVSTRGAKMLWTYTAIDGITTTIKEFLGTPKTVESRPSELLASRVNIPGLPVGHMPYIQRPTTAGGAVIYFFTQWNPFSGYGESGGVKQLCEGKSTEYIERKAYGFARDVMNKAFPMFGEWNIVDPKHVPTTGTNYMFTDPAGARNWATLWVRVVKGGDHYIYRDWPDAQTYGEWAIPSEDTHQPDGDPGDAQKTLGFGTEQLASEWRRLEAGVTGDGKREEIFQRFIDPRAGKTEHIEEHGGTCLVDKFAALQEPML